jgi:predicted nicotinamide N-methyase
MLALPYKRFIFEFNGDFVVSGKPIELSFPTKSRHPDNAEDGDTGCTIWDAAVFLVKLLESNKEIVFGKKVLELGSGLGLCGLSCRALGAQNVVLTDLPYILESTERNIQINGMENCVIARTLDWNSPESVDLGWESIDVVIASDTVWIESLIEPFVKTLEYCLSKNVHLQIYISNQRRSDIVWSRFIKLAERHCKPERICSEGNLEIYHLKAK